MSARIGPGGGTEVGRGSLRAALRHRALQLQNSRSCRGPEETSSPIPGPTRHLPTPRLEALPEPPQLRAGAG